MSSGVKAQDRLITCPKCNKTMKTKSFRYNHEKYVRVISQTDQLNQKQNPKKSLNLKQLMSL